MQCKINIQTSLFAPFCHTLKGLLHIISRDKIKRLFCLFQCVNQSLIHYCKGLWLRNTVLTGKKNTKCYYIIPGAKTRNSTLIYINFVFKKYNRKLKVFILQL